MVQEWSPDNQPFAGAGQIEYAEHSSFARAKKTVEVAPHVPHVDAGAAPNTVRRWQTGTEVATGSPLTLAPNKAYRIVSTVAVRLVLWKKSDITPAPTAPVVAAGDFMLPANTPIVISTKDLDTLETGAVSAAGIVQAVEVQ